MIMRLRRSATCAWESDKASFRWQIRPMSGAWLERTELLPRASMKATLSANASFFTSSYPMRDNDRVCRLSSCHALGDAEVDRIDLLHLAPGGWLSDNLINFKLWLLAGSYYERGHKPSDFTFLPTYVWADWTSSLHFYKRFTKQNPLLSRFIALPCFVNGNHWILAVIAHPSNLYTDSPDNHLPSTRTSFVVFDSIYHTSHTKTRKNMSNTLEGLLGQIAKEYSWVRHPEATAEPVPIFYPKVSAFTTGALYGGS